MSSLSINPTINTGTGLISGINISGLVDSLIAVERKQADPINKSLKAAQDAKAGVDQLSANLLSLQLSTSKLKDSATFKSFNAAVSDTNQLSVVTHGNATLGTTAFRGVNKATGQTTITRGFANENQQTIGLDGTLTISSGGNLIRPTKLDALNGGAGVHRGSIRITNSAGLSSDLDLTNALTVQDVVTKINQQSSLKVAASTLGGRLQLTDNSGGSSGSFSVADLNGGSLASDLGLSQTVSGTSISGSSIYSVTGDFSLSSLNDGNAIRHQSGKNDFQINLADGSTIAVNTDGVATINDLLNRINSSTSNSGKVTASLANDRLQLVDTTTGTNTLSVTNLNGSNATQVLGLDGNSSAGTLTGKRLTGGLNSVLLRNLRGGQGITTPGQVSLTDRSGATATVDLSSAESLDEVVSAINSATTSGGARLKIQARVNDQGNGLLITDTSGSNANNFTIADVGTGTVAANLGIAVNAAQTAVNSGNLGLRNVNEATSLSNYALNNSPVTPGSFKITDSAGNQAILSVNFTTQTLGDVLDKINAATNVQVTAKLNSTGDGFVLVDNAGGSGTLKVEDIGSTTAKDLRLTGTSTTGSDGKQQINSRESLVINVSKTDTLDSLASKISGVGGQVRASVINSGSSIAPFRLSIASTTTGAGSQFSIDDSGLNLGLTTQTAGRDAVLQVGDDPATAFFLTSSTNQFNNATTGLDVTLLNSSNTAASVTTTQDTSSLTTALNSFVSNYNKYIDAVAKLTAYDTATSTKAALQGNAQILAIAPKFSDIVNSVANPSSSVVHGLADIGLVVTSGGKLSLNSTKLQSALQDKPDEVTKLFINGTKGIGTRLDTLVTNLTDSTNGSLTKLSDTYDTNATAYQKQVQSIEDRLTIHRDRMLRQFYHMETALGTIQNQQKALSSFVSVYSTTTSSSSKN